MKSIQRGYLFEMPESSHGKNDGRKDCGSLLWWQGHWGWLNGLANTVISRSMVGGVLYILNHSRHHWTTQKWLGNNGLLPLEMIWGLLLWTSSRMAAMWILNGPCTQIRVQKLRLTSVGTMPLKSTDDRTSIFFLINNCFTQTSFHTLIPDLEINWSAPTQHYMPTTHRDSYIN